MESEHCKMKLKAKLESNLVFFEYDQKRGSAKRFDLGFLILHISHKSNVSFTTIGFPKDFFFKIGFSPWVSSAVLKNKLKSPPSITFLFVILATLFSIWDSLVRVSDTKIFTEIFVFCITCITFQEKTDWFHR